MTAQERAAAAIPRRRPGSAITDSSAAPTASGSGSASSTAPLRPTRASICGSAESTAGTPLARDSQTELGEPSEAGIDTTTVAAAV